MQNSLAQPRKQSIAHRGASSYTPEHTAAAYKLAMEQKVDFVEQDLGVTRDNELICIHDDTLERTTNVAEVFPEDKATIVARLRKEGRALFQAPIGQRIPPRTHFHRCLASLAPLSARRWG